MKRIKLLVVFCFIIPIFMGTATADGPPIDKDGVTVEHETLRLTDKQSSQAGIYRYVELNDDQLKQLNGGRSGTRPRMLEIITYPYPDCTCGMPFYGLWNARNEVQIPSNLLGITEEEMAKEGTPPEKIAEGCDDDFCVPYYRDIESCKKHMRAEMLSIDCDGNVFQQGERVSNLGKALKKTEARYAGSSETKRISVATPPLKSMESIRKTLLKISRFFTAKGYEVFSALNYDPDLFHGF